MKNALIFSSNFDGHRQVYVFIIAHELIKLGYKIHIAGNYLAKLNNSFYIKRLKDDESVVKIDTSGYKNNGTGISIVEFISLQKKYRVDLTIFAEADNHILLFNSQLLSRIKRFKGKTIGIFLRPFYFYEKFGFINKLIYLKRLILNWKSDNRLFHEVLNTQFRLLNESLFIDDHFVTKHKKTKWLPDVFQQYADILVIEQQTEQRKWIKKLNKFKSANADCFFILYFGTSQKRRGYDLLLKLAFENNACFIHCGLRDDNETFDFSIDELRNNLKIQGKLFETNEYITDPYCIEYFFKAVSHLILPYRDFYGSSGVMLQALGYNIPVLVPDVGIMGYRTNKYSLGLTYDQRSFSLDEQFKRFIETPKEIYQNSIEHYMNDQSVNKLKQVLSEVFSNSKSTIELPNPS